MNNNHHISPSSSSSMATGTAKISAEAQNMLETFWSRKHQDVLKTTSNDFRNQELPLARIKKIMKLDEDVKMISGEAPVLFAKAVEFFISELSLRAWINTEENNRRTLQRNDIGGAVSKYDQFDFLIDIVPREEANSGANKMKNHRNQQQQHQFLDASTAAAIADPFGNYFVQIAGQPGFQAATASGGHPPTIQILQTGAGQTPFSIGTPAQIIQVPVAAAAATDSTGHNETSATRNSSHSVTKTGPLIIAPELAPTATALPIAISSQQYQTIIQNHHHHHHHQQQQQQQQQTSGQPILLSAVPAGAAVGPIPGYATTVKTLISSTTTTGSNHTKIISSSGSSTTAKSRKS